MNGINQSMSLIPVIDEFIGEEEQPCVDARTLHQWLKNGDRFSTWIKSRIKTYGFIENEDFVCLSVISETQRANGQKGKAKQTDYLLTLDVAKELSMVENNEQGRAARRYFINCEKVVAFFAQIPLFVVDDATFYDLIILAFWTAYNFHIYKFCINIIK